MPDGSPHLPDLQLPIDRIVAQRNAALGSFEAAIEELESAYNTYTLASGRLRDASFGAIHYDERRDRSERLKPFEDSRPIDREKMIDAFRHKLDASVWEGLASRINFLNMMDAADKERWRQSLRDDAIEITVENVEATLTTLVNDAPTTFRRGLARTFSKLDKRFKSHNVFRFDRRVILNRFIDEWGDMTYGSYASDVLTDIERAFATLDGVGPEPDALRNAIRDSRSFGRGRRQSEVETRYFRVKTFKNGNAHLWFTRQDLVEAVNKQLAAYYGEVMPDGVQAKSDKIEPGTALAKDLQFYATPEKLAKSILEYRHVKGLKVLEPSAGEGAFVKELIARGAGHVTAIEVHPDRCDKIPRASNVEIWNGNFLDMEPKPEYDLVAMNPPFYGTHWMSHVLKAFCWLKEGGTLIAILPVTAEIGESAKHEKFRKWAGGFTSRWNNMFQSLPMDSFLESGTRIQTVKLILTKPQTSRTT